MTAKAVPTYYFGKQRFQSEEEAVARRRDHGVHGSQFTNRTVQSLYDLIQEGSVLDLACGNGRNLPLLLNRFPKAFGCDISAAMLKVAQQSPLVQSSVPLAQLEAENLPFPDRTFDGVFCARFFHHIPTPEIRLRILSEIFRVARRGAVVTYKARFSPEHLRYSVRRYFPSRALRAHRHFLGEQEFESAATDCGWRLVQVISSRRHFSSNRTAVFERA